MVVSPGARRRGAPVLATLALAAFLLAPALPLPPAGFAAAQAGTAGPVELRYIVHADDPGLLAAGRVEVTWRASNFAGRISAFCLQTDRHDYTVVPGSFGDVPPWQDHPLDTDPSRGIPDCSQGYRIEANGATTVEGHFVVNVTQRAFSPCGCEFNSYLSDAWGVVKAEALAVPFSYAFYAPQPDFHATVQFLVPAGWNVAAPWRQLADGSYELPGDGAPLPRGFIALGQFTPELHDEPALGKQFVYARLANELRDKDLLFSFLDKATPYYQSVYGNVTGQRILVISAGPPMFTGGLGSSNSLFVHENSTLETIAHEYAHVWQLFQTFDTPGLSSIWLNEGDADLHGALARYVTEIQPGWNYSSMQDYFDAQYQLYSQKPDFQQPLDAAQYGGTYEQVAYKKGLFTLLFLDHEVRNLTGGAAGLGDVLREANDYYENVVVNRSGDKRMTNDDILHVVNTVVQRYADVDMTNFFTTYVHGTSWPPEEPMPQEAAVVFDRLSVSPATVSAGDPVTLTAFATNLRDTPQTRTVDVYLDGAVVQERAVSLAAQQQMPVTFTVPAPGPGDHTARLAYLTAPFHVLTPPALSIAQVAPLGRVQAGVAFDVAVDVDNQGETPGRATVEAAFGAEDRSADLDVPAQGQARARIPFLSDAQGAVPLEVTVTLGNQTLRANATVVVGPRDPYPARPDLEQKSVVNDLRNAVPGLGSTLALGALLAAAVATRSRRRRP